MSDTVITVENLGKKYALRSAAPERYTALRDVIGRNLTQPWRWFRGGGAAAGEFWALQDVSFEVKRGEVLGIIGRNGAGKSTLLKILSRITEPTRGRARIRGRMASLLEVGTGFHPELTGRENIFLNGAILGMSRAEIRRNFDAIVEFAEVEKFIDSPVKHYSSGMYVRLAFAVAAHLEPEILIVDEVLAVGDLQFQKKCLGKMEDVAAHGRTVLFVSHDMATVLQFCRKGILLNAGRVEYHGDMSAVAARYLQQSVPIDANANLAERGDRSGSGDAQFLSIELRSGDERRSTFTLGTAFTVRLVIRVDRPIGNGQIAVVIVTDDGVPVHDLENTNEHFTWPSAPGTYEFTITVPRLLLFPGTYRIDLWLGDNQRSRVDYLRRAIDFQVIQTVESGPPVALARRDGLVFVNSVWELHRQ